jgi:tetratricopeptide (TPR) repeat protein
METDRDPGAPSRDTVRTRAALLLLVVLTLTAFSPVKDAGFLNYDDPHYVTNNPNVLKGLRAEGLVWAFSSFDAANWHPVTWLSHMLDVTLFGLRPGWHHLTNVALHAVAAALLLLVLKGMTGALWPSSLTAALFAVHPLHVESVAWISERKDVLSGLLLVLTLMFYLRHARRPGPGRYLTVAAVFLIGLLTKPMLVTLPLVLLLLDWWPLHRFRPAQSGTPESRRAAAQRLLLEKVPLLALSAASCGITYLAQQRGGAMMLTELFPFWSRAGNAVVSYLRYIGKTLFPVHLLPFYPHPGTSLPREVAVLSLALLIGITVLVVAARRRRPWLTAGWLWFLGTLVPVIGFVQVGRQAMADRYSYLPLIGLFFALAWEAWSRAAGTRRGPAVLGLSAAAILTTLTLLSLKQAALWRDTVTLFTHVTRVDPGNFVAYNMLGSDLLVNRDAAGAARLFRKALEINPLALEARYNLGLALAQTGDTDAAIEQFTAVIGYRKGAARDAEALYNLGNLLLEKDRAEEALRNFDDAVAADPGRPQIHVSRGLALAALQRLPAAAAAFRSAVALDPENATARYHLGRALVATGAFEEAVTEFRAALALKPDFAEAHNNLGVTLAELGRREEALTHFREAVRLAPDYAEARFNLARAGVGR